MGRSRSGKTTESPRQRLRGVRSFLGWGLVMTASAVAGNVFWENAGNRVTAGTRFAISPDCLVLSDPPAWIHHDVRPEILLALELEQRDGITVLDPDLPEKMAMAARQHPWIASVKGIRKLYPRTILFEVVWRTPVAMVRVPEGLLPVDENGVLLPTRDFTPIEASQYPRIYGVESLPAGPAGYPWGDPLVNDAASLAKLLSGAWKKFAFHHIEPSSGDGPPAPSAEGRGLTIVTHSGSRVIWGAPPNRSSSQEVSPEDKLRRLEALFREHGSFDSIDGPQVVDIRFPDAIKTAPLR